MIHSYVTSSTSRPSRILERLYLVTPPAVELEATPISRPKEFGFEKGFTHILIASNFVNIVSHSLWEIRSFHLIVLISPLTSHASIALRAYRFQLTSNQFIVPYGVVSALSYTSFQISACRRSTALASILVIVLFGQNFDPDAFVPS